MIEDEDMKKRLNNFLLTFLWLNIIFWPFGCNAPNAPAVGEQAYPIEFTQINIDGFGDSGNVESDSRWVFEDQVYVGTGNNSGGEIWRYSGGTNWVQIGDPGFGNPENYGIEVLKDTFAGYVYAGTLNFNGGAELWRSINGNDWDQVFSGGLGDSNNWGAWTSGSGFNGYLYLQLANDVTGIEIRRSGNGFTEWEQVNTGVFHEDSEWGNFYQFDNELYFTVKNQTTGARIWKTNDGTNWSLINGDGLGDPNNIMIRLVEFKDQIYASTRNHTEGGEVWRSSDWTNWELISDNGFGNPNNVDMNIHNPISSEDFLYVGTRNNATGGELWRSFDGVTWVQVVCCGFDDINNSRIRTFSSDNDLYVASNNNVTGVEVWKEIANTSTGDGITIEPVDDTTGTTPLAITFESVSDEGTTSLVTLPEGDPEPIGFKLDEPATYYEITTTAQYSGIIEVCIDYSGVNYADEEELRLFHFDDEWVDITTSLDTGNDIICGNTSSLSAFVIFEPEHVVEIDIKPGSYPNCFNQNAHGVIPVTIFGNVDLNVYEINLDSLLLRGIAIKMVGQNNKYLSHNEYVPL